MNHFEELLAKYNKTMEDISFEYENMSDEDLDSKFAELFDVVEVNIDESNAEDDIEDNTKENTIENGSDDNSDITDEATDEIEHEEHIESEVVEPETFSRTYELSHDDIRCALYNLLIPYEEADGKYYCITEVYDDYFVYESWCGGTVYGQAYVKDEEVVSFEGERYELFKELLTASEKAALDTMRSNYEALSEKLKVYEDAEIESKKVKLLNSTDYASIKDNEDFIKLVDDHANISYEELQAKCDQIILDTVKAGKYSVVSSDVELVSTSKKQFANPVVTKKKPSRYGNLFKKDKE